MVAHEVRNPLGVVFNSVASLRRLLGDRGGDVRMLLEILSEEAGRLDRIVSELLDFARPSALSPRAVRLEDVLRGAVEAARRTSPAPEVEVRMELPEALPELVLDEQLLHQALVNLVVNAFHAMPSGGRVTLRAALPPAPPGTLRIEVEDQGPGVSAELGERVFQPFVTTKAFGTGLGLSVVRRIADAHGGRIELQPAVLAAARGSSSASGSPRLDACSPSERRRGTHEGRGPNARPAGGAARRAGADGREPQTA